MECEDCHSEEERKSSEIAVQDVASMYGSLLSLADTPHYSREILTKNWWCIVKKWYPDLLTQLYCVPPVHFNAVSYNYTQEQTTYQEPHERFGVKTILPMQYSNIRDDEAQQRVLRTLQTFLKTKRYVAFILSNVEFQNYLNKNYEVDEGVVDLVKLTPEDEGEIDVMVIDKTCGIFVLEVKATGYRTDLTPQETLKSCAAPIGKASRQLHKNAAVLRRILSDLDPHQMIKIRTGVLMPNLDREILRNTLEMSVDITGEFMKAIGAHSLEQLLDCCLCSDGFPPANSSAPEDLTFDNINRFWSTLENVTGEMEHAITDETYQQLVARFCGPLSTVKIYTEKSMPRVRLETIPPRKKDTKRRSKKDLKLSKIKVIPFECRTIAGAAREVARRFSELVLLPEQIDWLQQKEDFVHLEGPPGTGKTLMLLLRILTWLDGNNMVWMLSLAPPSRSVTHMLYEQVKLMLYQHKGREEADRIIKKRLRIFTMTRPDRTLDDKYFEHILHTWRLRAKLKDSKMNWSTHTHPVSPLSDRKVCLVLCETGVSGKGPHVFFNQVSACQRSGCFTSDEAGFTAGLSVWSASMEKCGRPCYATDPQERMTADKFGIYRQLRMPLRCPPSIQRTLMLVQPDLDHNVFTFHKDYLLPNPLAGQDSEFRYQYPADGLPVHLIAHGGHKKANQPIWLCRECGEELATYLKDVLNIGDEEAIVSDVPLCYKDVLIVGTRDAIREIGSIGKSVSLDGFFLPLYQKGLRVAICPTGEEGGSALPPGDFILATDITSTYGLERAVVVVLPEHPEPVQSIHDVIVNSTTSTLCADDDDLEMDGGEEKEKTSSLCRDRLCHSDQEASITSSQDMSPEKNNIWENRSGVGTVRSYERKVGKSASHSRCWDENTPRNVTLRKDFDLMEEDSDPPYGKSTDVDIKQRYCGEVAHCADQCACACTTRTTVNISTENAVNSTQCPGNKSGAAGQDGPTGGTSVELSVPGGAGEKIEEALRTLTPAARRDLFYIGSRATCQLILFHFGKKRNMNVMQT